MRIDQFNRTFVLIVKSTRVLYWRDTFWIQSIFHSLLLFFFSSSFYLVWNWNRFRFFILASSLFLFKQSMKEYLVIVSKRVEIKKHPQNSWLDLNGFWIQGGWEGVKDFRCGFKLSAQEPFLFCPLKKKRHKSRIKKVGTKNW